MQHNKPPQTHKQPAKKAAKTAATHKSAAPVHKTRPRNDEEEEQPEDPHRELVIIEEEDEQAEATPAPEPEKPNDILRRSVV